MDHEAAKTTLAQAEGLVQRTAAVTQALELGMNLPDIEDYLDWLDATRVPATAPVNVGWVTRFSRWLGGIKAWGLTPRHLTTNSGSAAHSQPATRTKPR